MDIQYVIGEIMTLVIMAFALGLDAFSISLGMGMVSMRLRQVFYIGIVIGIFHVVMPMLGMILGRVLSAQFGSISTIVGGLLLIFLGFHVIYSSLFGEEDSKLAPVGFGLILFSFSVSLDSFSVGLSLGIYGVRTLATIIIFGVTSMVLTWAGLLLGRRVKTWFGTYGEVLGGSILLGFGLKLLFPI